MPMTTGSATCQCPWVQLHASVPRFSYQAREFILSSSLKDLGSCEDRPDQIHMLRMRGKHGTVCIQLVDTGYAL